MMLHNLQCIVFLAIFLHAFSSLDAKATPNAAIQSLSETISSKINHTIFQVHESYNNLKKNATCYGGNIDMQISRALDACYELLRLSITYLNTSMSQVLDSNKVQDVQALLSGASTNPHTCLEGLAQGRNKFPIIYNQSKDSLIKISNQIEDTLTLVAKLPRAWKPISSSSGYVYSMSDDGYPAWMDEDDRKMLLDTEGNANFANFVVAQDGSGNFKTIREALNAAPSGSMTRFTIYIKAGIYYEDLEVMKPNIMFVGAGMDETWIRGRKSVADGLPTFVTAVLGVSAEGFIAKEIAIENYAGPAKFQAVALRTNGDRSAFYHCRIIAYQDTLFVHSLRQFFRECEVHGTIDFIFGNSAAVFQKCNFYARKPLPYQQIVFTAQGRTSYYQTTGISIMDSRIDADSSFVPERKYFKSFLGRPWGEYSRTVIIKSYIGDLIDPVGWMEWDGQKGLNTLYYGEYFNYGPGASTFGRVKWRGYKVIIDWREAAQFTAGAFIHGRGWLMRTGIPYYLDLPAI